MKHPSVPFIKELRNAYSQDYLNVTLIDHARNYPEEQLLKEAEAITKWLLRLSDNHYYKYLGELKALELFEIPDSLYTVNEWESMAEDFLSLLVVNYYNADWPIAYPHSLKLANNHLELVILLH